MSTFGGFDAWVNNAGGWIFGSCPDVEIPDMPVSWEVYSGRLHAQPECCSKTSWPTDSARDL